MATKQAVKIEITPPNFKVLPIRVEGTSPLMTHKFSEKMRKQIEGKQTATETTSKKREPKDYAAEYNTARYVDRSGKFDGVPAGAFRAAMIGACRMVSGLPMTRAKGAFHVIAQGNDVTDGTPLVKIEGKSEHDTRPVRLESGVADLRNRPRYDDWACDFDIEYDADLLSAKDIANLLARAGCQVGLCELRPSAPNSFGGDFGTFRVTTSKRKVKA